MKRNLSKSSKMPAAGKMLATGKMLAAGKMHAAGTKLTAAALILAMLMPLQTDTIASAKKQKAPKLNVKSNITLQTGAAKKIKVKKNGTSKIVKVSWKASGACVKLSKKTGTATKVTAQKEGTSKLTATVRFKSSKASKAASRKLKCTIKVTAETDGKATGSANSGSGASGSGNSGSAAQSSGQPQSQNPGSPLNPSDGSNPGNNPNNNPSDNNTPSAPTANPAPTPVPSGTLLSALSPYVENVGTCVSYSTGGGNWGGNWGGGFWGRADTDSQLFDANTTAFLKENYNSITAENQMKSSYILGGSANLISVSEAKEQGYYIPEGYTENNVPTLNYNSIDSLMKYASENGLRIRYHGLLWHEQSSNWFYRKNYSDNAGYVTPEIMDMRIEYFIKNVMNHVYNSEYKDVIYCWDVVNEYFHMTECISRIGTDKSDDVKCFYEVYGDSIFEDPTDPANSPVKTNPAYVKKAFKCAYDVLKSFGLENKVELVYNDYDTDFPEVRDCMIKVCDYINSKDELNPDGAKLVTTCGMQGHDKMGIHTIAGHKDTIEAIKAAGYNLQYTEVDLALKGHTTEEQLQYWKDWITLVINESKSGAHFTCFSWWGLSDSASWLGSGESPLLCGSSISDKKAAYYTVIGAAEAAK